MDRDVAKLLMKKLKALDKPMDDVLATMEQISSPNERKRFRKEMAKIIAGLCAMVTMPIVEQYPDLSPSKDWQA